jgi:hypothetical protein
MTFVAMDNFPKVAQVCELVLVCGATGRHTSTRTPQLNTHASVGVYLV